MLLLPHFIDKEKREEKNYDIENMLAQAICPETHMSKYYKL